MISTNTIFFWFGGVLTQTVPELTEAELAPGARGQVDLKARQRLRSLAEELSRGVIDGAAYCQQAQAAFGIERPATALEERICSAGSLRPQVIELIRRIPETYSLWLVSDYPRTWYEAIAKRLGTGEVIPGGRTVFLADLGLPSMVPDLFYGLTRTAQRTMRQCLLIDNVSARAVEATRHGLPAIIYVYPERLKHELALQGILQTEADVMHPSLSQRVKV